LTRAQQRYSRYWTHGLGVPGAERSVQSESSPAERNDRIRAVVAEKPRFHGRMHAERTSAGRRVQVLCTTAAGTHTHRCCRATRCPDDPQPAGFHPPRGAARPAEAAEPSPSRSITDHQPAHARFPAKRSAPTRCPAWSSAPTRVADDRGLARVGLAQNAVCLRRRCKLVN
jgi:hypothetical protein